MIWSAGNPPGPHGSGADSIQELLDGLCRSTMVSADIPGMTVAVSHQGRMVYNCGFGYSDWNERSPMREHMRAPIGSSTKVITALAMMRLIQDTPSLSLSTRVYGPQGVLKASAYMAAARQGIRRFYPLVGIGIGRNNRVTAWYSDGQYTQGTSTDLQSHAGPKSWTAPPDPGASKNLLGIDQGGADNFVYSWYRNGTYQYGTVGDLGAYGSGTFTSRSNSRIVGLAADTRENIFYAYYNDGKVSSGTLENGPGSKMDLTSRWVRDFAVPETWRRRYDIVDVARSENDVMVAWYSDDQASKGTSTNLSDVTGLHPFSRREVPGSRREWEDAYESLQVRHLLSHTAGFVRSGKWDQAAKKYEQPTDSTLPYRFSNFYVLSTQPLLFKPGERSSYSNHGMGLVGHLIEELTGQPWYQYMKQIIFEPASAAIVPAWEFDLFDDSRSHNVKKDKVTVQGKKTAANPRSAAGSLRASAGSLIAVMLATDRLPNHADVLNAASSHEMESRPFPEQAPTRALGWQIKCQGSACTKRKLWHNGATSAGKSYLAKYQDFTIDGVTVSDVNVAVISNSGDTSATALARLCDDLARTVAQEGTPTDYDLLHFTPIP